MVNKEAYETKTMTESSQFRILKNIPKRKPEPSYSIWVLVYSNYYSEKMQ